MVGRSVQDLLKPACFREDTMPRIATMKGYKELESIREPGRYPAGGDSKGLYLQIMPAGARSWVFRYSISVNGVGKRREMGLGDCRVIGLAEARKAAAVARQLVNQGVDPIEAREREKARLEVEALQSQNKSFRDVALTVIENRKAEWRNPKHLQQWRNTLETYAYPTIGHLFVESINVHHIKELLDPIWLEKYETANRLRGRIESVMDYAISSGYRTLANPATKQALRSHLPKVSRTAFLKHFPAMSYEELPAFFSELWVNDSISARALAFTILTAKRSGEVRGLLRSEVDTKSKVWTIPAERMKAGRAHREPLPEQTLDLLKGLHHIEGVDLVFPGRREGARLSDMTLTVLLRRMRPGVTVHGFRSTFRQWTAEQTDYPREVCEMALAHTLESKVEAAYQRSDLLEKRLQLMEEWVRYCLSDVIGKRSIF